MLCQIISTALKEMGWVLKYKTDTHLTYHRICKGPKLYNTLDLKRPLNPICVILLLPQYGVDGKAFKDRLNELNAQHRSSNT